MEERKLSVIMFTDMVGYTALMLENERQAKNLRNKTQESVREFSN